MSLNQYLSENRSRIIKQWRDAILSSYPGDTQRFLRKEKDPFSNPVGHIIQNEIGNLYDGVIAAGDILDLVGSLDKIIRVRAVQDFKPSHAIGFVLELKRIIREGWQEAGREKDPETDLQAMEDRIDRVALLAFDLFSQCRQKIYEIRVKEVQNQVGALLKRANLAKELSEDKPERQED